MTYFISCLVTAAGCKAARCCKAASPRHAETPKPTHSSPGASCPLPSTSHATPAQTPECTDLFQKWVLDMATHFKSLDQQHLLTVGSEGEARAGCGVRVPTLPGAMELQASEEAAGLCGGRRS